MTRDMTDPYAVLRLQTHRDRVGRAVSTRGTGTAPDQV